MRLATKIEKERYQKVFTNEMKMRVQSNEKTSETILVKNDVSDIRNNIGELGNIIEAVENNVCEFGNIVRALRNIQAALRNIIEAVDNNVCELKNVVAAVRNIMTDWRNKIEELQFQYAKI